MSHRRRVKTGQCWKKVKLVMPNYDKFDRAFQLCDDTQKGTFIWRCQVRTLIAFMGYNMHHELIREVLFKQKAPIQINHYEAWKIVMSYHAHVECIEGQDQLMRKFAVFDPKVEGIRPLVVRVRNGYGVRRMDFGEYSIFSEYRAKLRWPLSSDFLHNNPHCKCVGDYEMEKLIEKQFEYTNGVQGYL